MSISKHLKEHAILGIAKPQTIQSNSSLIVKPFGLPEENPGVRNYTLRQTYKCSLPFYAVRFYFFHPSTTVLSGVIANFTTSNSCATASIPGNPTWKNITINGSTALTITPSATGAYPAVTVSDIIACTPQARVDGGTGYLIDVGIYIPTAGNTVALRVPGVTDATTVSQTVDIYGQQSGAWAGDAVTTPASFSRSIVGLGCPIAVEFFTAQQTGSQPILFACGDSITQGLDGARLHFGAAGIAARDRGYALHNAGLSGKTRDVYLAYGTGIVQTVKPKFALLAPWSPNDADFVTVGVNEAVLKNAAQWITTCYSVGAIPILTTPTPKDGLTAPQETIRRSVVQSVKDLCASTGVRLIDRDSVYTNYTLSTGGFKAGLSADGLHPNAAGYALEAALFNSVI